MSEGNTTIVGSLGRDPELRYTASGAALCSFTVAQSRRYKSGDEWKEDTAWIDVTAWRDLAEHIVASCTKGTRVIVSGYLRQEEWDDKDTGKKRSKLSLVADACGVELRWATAIVEKIERDSASTGDRSRRGSTPVYGDEEPFIMLDVHSPAGDYRNMTVSEPWL